MIIEPPRTDTSRALLLRAAVVDGRTVRVRGASAAVILEALRGIADVEVERRTPGPVDATAPRTDDMLQERETAIVTLVASGLSNQAIADELYLSVNTVKSYIRSAYRKMGVESRSQAVLWAIDHGLAGVRRAHDRD